MTAQALTPGTIEHYGVHPHPPQYSLLDVFSGAGGLSLGLHWAGFHSIGAVEVDASAAETYDHNFGPNILRDKDNRPISIEEVDFRPFRGRVDLLAGGPPCQGFSLLGTRLTNDPRNHLWHEFMRAVDEVRPRAFLMENVPPMLQTEEGRFTVCHARELGYDVVSGILSAEQFGVPQKRKRAFFLGIMNGSASLPKPEQWTVPRTVRWALDGIPSQPTNEDIHFGRDPTSKSLERYAAVPEGGNRFDLMRNRPDITPRCWLEKPKGSTDVFGRLWWDRPSVTIRTEFYKPEKGRYLHPTEHRPITHREAARIQTFPDEFVFEGSKVDIAKQIGNAVPPVLAYAIGKNLKNALSSEFVVIQTQTQFSLFD